eukprot:scaffold120282_cov31-Tisochrysis_lutea.AAC.3
MLCVKVPEEAGELGFEQRKRQGKIFGDPHPGEAIGEGELCQLDGRLIQSWRSCAARLSM